ncbi:MAG TPA: hypothetical protein VIG24_07770 [Acidimicrobiia bacterium]
MMSEQEALVPMIIGEVRDQLEALGYSHPNVMAEGGQLKVTLPNGRQAATDIPHIHNVFDISTDLTEALHSVLTGPG